MNPRSLRLDGRVVLVTGGSRGIGRAVSLLLGRLGAQVAVAYRGDSAAAAATVAELRALGAEAEAFTADLAAPEAGEALVESVIRRFSRLDALVVNHGIWKPAPLAELRPERWQETLAVNLGGAFGVCAPAARHMAERGSGSIVLVSSTAGQRGEARYSPYAASKGALLALTKSLAAELAPRGVRVNGVAPGWVMTDMSREALEGPEGPAAIAKIPLGRVGTPEEIAGPVAFLLSDLASFVYGEIVCVNGGAVMAS